MKKDDRAFLELFEKFTADKGLTEKDLQIMERWKFAHDQQVNHFKVGSELTNIIAEQFNVSARTAREDVANSKKFFITEEMIDKNYWRGMLLHWQLKGLKLAYDNDSMKDFNAGIRNLYLILGLHHKTKGVDPKVLKQNVFNFFSDPKRIGIPEVQEAEIIELVEEITKDENITAEQKKKILKDAGIFKRDTDGEHK